MYSVFMCESWTKIQDLCVDPGFMCGFWTEIQDLCVDPGPKSRIYVWILDLCVEIQDLGRPRPAAAEFLKVDRDP